LLAVCGWQEIGTCRIGCGVVPDTKPMPSRAAKVGRMDESKDGGTRLQPAPVIETKVRSIWSRLSLRKSTSDTAADTGSELNASCYGTTQVSLFGQLAEVAIFMEPLLDTHVQTLYRLGQLVFTLLSCLQLSVVMRFRRGNSLSTCQFCFQSRSSFV
jgi:hypothetical protein